MRKGCVADKKCTDSNLIDFRRPADFFQDINAVTSVLKAFFRELPDPLLTSELYEEFIIASRK